MNLKNFSLVSPAIHLGEVLKAIKAAIPPEAIETAIAQTRSQECRIRSLPAHLVVALVIAMSLWSRDSMRDVLKNLVDGLTEAWIKVGKYWHVPMFISNYSSPTEIRTASNERSRRRSASGQLFHQIVRPMATDETIGALIQGLRIVGKRWHYFRCTR